MSSTTKFDRNSNETDPYERLLSEMPRIADAVNAFESADVQKTAFDALVSAIGANVAPVLHAVEPDPVNTVTETEATPTDTDEPKGRRRRSSKAAKKRNFSPTKGLNFAPADKPSLAEFIIAKDPRTLFEKNLIACHYLTEMMAVENVSTNDVLAVYMQAGWKPSADPENSLHATYSQKRWLDTEDMSSIKVLWAGTNHIATMGEGSQSDKDAA